MTEVHKNNRIGVGMKPRINQAQKPNRANPEPESRPEAEGQEHLLAGLASKASAAAAEGGSLDPNYDLEKALTVASDSEVPPAGVEGDFSDIDGMIPNSKDPIVETAAVESANPGVVLDAKRDTAEKTADGTAFFMVKIEEGYVEAIREWAQADGKTVEQFLSEMLYSNYSVYGEPAPSR